MGDEALKHFGVTEADLLGKGDEARVFALGADAVVRVYSDRTPSSHVRDLERFYRTLDTRAVGFQVTRFGDIVELAGEVCVVEPRIPGLALADMLRSTQGELRERAFANYMSAASQIQLIGFDADYYGQVLGHSPVRASTWSGYLQDRVRASLAEAPWAKADLIDPDRALVLFDGLAEERQGAPRVLAHGDYHPGNVLVDPDGVVTGVIDFASHSVMGDPLLDLTSAAFFVDDRTDRALATAHAPDVDATTFAEATRLYWLYYSFFYLSNKVAKPALYDLCVRTLNAAV